LLVVVIKTLSEDSKRWAAISPLRSRWMPRARQCSAWLALKSGHAATISGWSEPLAALIASGEVDLSCVLDGDHTATSCGCGRYFCLYEINSVFQRVKERLAANQAAKLTSHAIDLRLTDPAQYEVVKDKAARLLRYNQRTRENFPRDGFLSWCIDSLPASDLLEPADEKILRGFAERCGKAGEACVKEGRFTEDGLAIIEFSAGGTDHMFGKLFGRKP
jgi:hypothetical protein